MRIIETVLYLEYEDLLSSGISASAVKKASYRNSSSWRFIKDPLDNRKLLCEYERLADKYKILINDSFGNPYDYVATQPIKALVTTDIQAQKFYTGYRYGDHRDKCLPLNHIDQYTRAASFMNMIVRCTDDPQFIKKQLGLSVLKFYANVERIIKADKLCIPSVYRRLTQKVKEYKEAGYACLINSNFGNSNGAKVADELSESVLLKLIEKPHVDDRVIARAYNNWAKLNDRKTISHATVGNYRRQNEAYLLNQKAGAKAWFDKYSKINKRRRASCPMACWEHDDNDLDLYFIKNKRGTASQVYYYGRYVIAVVIDTFNDYIVGWAMAETYTKDLIKLAYLDALYHVKEISGIWALPHQIRSDRFGLDAKLTNDLAQFYQRLATYTPAKAKSARGKYIEQSFGKKWHQVLAHYKNYAGHNIQSKSGINAELIEANKRSFPNETEAPFQVAEFINKMRNLQSEENGPSRQEVWLEALHASELARQKEIGYEDVLLLLGTQHTFHNQNGDNKVKITNRGLEITINKKFHEYDIPADIYMDVVGKRVHVIYDPYNPDHVLLMDGSLRFIASKLHEDDKLPSALIDYKTNDRARINDRLRAMEDHVRSFSEKKNRRDNLIERSRVDTDGLLQSGLLIKGQKQAAELAHQNHLLGGADDFRIDDALNSM